MWTKLLPLVQGMLVYSPQPFPTSAEHPGTLPLPHTLTVPVGDDRVPGCVTDAVSGRHLEAAIYVVKAGLDPQSCTSGATAEAPFFSSPQAFSPPQAPPEARKFWALACTNTDFLHTHAKDGAGSRLPHTSQWLLTAKLTAALREDVATAPGHRQARTPPMHLGTRHTLGARAPHAALGIWRRRRYGRQH